MKINPVQSLSYERYEYEKHTHIWKRVLRRQNRTIEMVKGSFTAQLMLKRINYTYYGARELNDPSHDDAGTHFISAMQPARDEQYWETVIAYPIEDIWLSSSKFQCRAKEKDHAFSFSLGIWNTARGHTAVLSLPVGDEGRKKIIKKHTMRSLSSLVSLVRLQFQTYNPGNFRHICKVTANVKKEGGER